MQAVRCRGVTKTFGSGHTAVQALRGVDVDVFANELTLLVGPSGCGKTTLLTIVTGLMEPTAGTVEVFDRNVEAMSAREKIAFRGKTLGFIFQDHNLLPSLTAAENVAVPLLLFGEPRKQARTRAAEVLDRVGLADRVDAYPRTLSGGEQQRVAVARALVHRPSLIVADEPTASLDLEKGRTVMALLREVGVGDGRAVIVVTHDTRIFDYGDRIARMNDGVVAEVTRNGHPPR